MRSHRLLALKGIRQTSVKPLLLLAAVLLAVLPNVSVHAQTIYDSDGGLGTWNITSGTLNITTDGTPTMTLVGYPSKSGAVIDGVAVFDLDFD